MEVNMKRDTIFNLGSIFTLIVLFALFLVSCGGKGGGGNDSGGSNTPEAYADISGNWNFSDSGSIKCVYGDGTSDSSNPSGTGSFYINQNNNNINWIVSVNSSDYPRSGTINGNNIQVAGDFVIPLVSGVNFSQNTYSASGTLSADTLTFQLSGTGTAVGSYQGMTFNCSGADTLTATRLQVASTTVTYSGNGDTGGSVPVDSTNYKQGQTVTVLGNTGNLVKTGFAFVGWNTQANGSGTTYTQGQTFTMGAANVTLYAKWTANQTYSISGTVTAASVGFQGVTMTLNTSATTTTDANGAYSFTGLANGSYTVTPSNTGYIFSPSSKSVTVNGANVSGQDFTASSTSTAILSENFEGGSLDPRITIETVGAFNSSPGISNITDFGSTKAFGFGRSACGASCFNGYITSLKITFPTTIFVSSISFKEMELYGNWGSGGKIYIDGNSLTPAGNPPPWTSGFDPSVMDFGRNPWNDGQADSTYRSHTFSVNMNANIIELKVGDITSSSEIFIDDLEIK
jgi:uncharacterized repeat protein (TIGR02543 family)